MPIVYEGQHERRNQAGPGASQRENPKAYQDAPLLHRGSIGAHSSRCHPARAETIHRGPDQARTEDGGRRLAMSYHHSPNGSNKWDKKVKPQAKKLQRWDTGYQSKTKIRNSGYANGLQAEVDRKYRAWLKRRGLPENDFNYFHHANTPNEITENL